MYENSYKAEGEKMAKKGFWIGMPVMVLAFGITIIGCDTGGGGDGWGGGFVPVTGITYVPTAAFMNTPLSLSGTVEPANATNKTIVWIGANVSGGVFTAPSAGNFMVTAIVVNGASRSSPYTQNFTITAYDVGSGGGSNPFGSTTPFIWAMDNQGGTVYVIIGDSTWEAKNNEDTYNSGTYSRIGNTGAQWVVTGGGNTGNTGIAIIEAGKMLVRNLTHEYSSMNGSFTKLNTGLSLTGTWVTTGKPFIGADMKIAAGGGNFTNSISPDGSTWRELMMGTYTADTNPAPCTITEVNTGVLTGGADAWVAWGSLSPTLQSAVGGSQAIRVIIYADKCETLGVTFYP
jgi:hypothetical protein